MDKYLGLEKILPKENIKYNESMKKHTTVRVGGNVSCLVYPTTKEELIKVLKYAKENELKFYVIGNGSNLLVQDEDLDALIIQISNRYSSIEFLDNEQVEVSAGMSLPKLATLLKNRNLTGLEFACGIPGTVGGAVRMNAGAYGSEMKNVVEKVTYLDEDLNICEIKNEDINFSYRYSCFKDKPKHVILSTVIRLEKGDYVEIETKMKEYSNLRRTKQPLEYPNFGSVFKRPEGYFVGKLVQDSDLKGYKIGGAQVSTKHTGFIVNVDNATCEDILNLIKHIQKVVLEKFNVELETEVEIIGGSKK